MKIEQFIEEFHKSQNKEAYVKKHVVNTYVPYEQKIALANNLVKKTMTASNGDMVRNTPAIYMNYVFSLVYYYTDVEVDKDKSLEVLNAIEKDNISPILISAIGNDANSLDAVIKMVVEDAIQNHCDLVNFMTIKSDNIQLILDKAEEALKGLPQRRGNDGKGEDK